jgi:hypothetical protein
MAVPDLEVKNCALLQLQSKRSPFLGRKFLGGCGKVPDSSDGLNRIKRGIKELWDGTCAKSLNHMRLSHVL